MPSDADEQRELRRLLGRAASAQTASQRAADNAAGQVVFALANGGLIDPGPDRLTAAAIESEAARRESARLATRVREAQRAVDALQPGDDADALRTEAQSLIKDGQTLCESADELRASLPNGFGNQGAAEPSAPHGFGASSAS